MNTEKSVELERYLAVPRNKRLSVGTVRAALWVLVAYIFASRDLKTEGVRTVVRCPPELPAGARRGVEAALRRLSPTCLQRSLIQQRWLVEHGVPTEVMIGVDKRPGEFAAHAWLDYETNRALSEKYRIIHRIASPEAMR